MWWKWFQIVKPIKFLCFDVKMMWEKIGESKFLRDWCKGWCFDGGKLWIFNVVTLKSLGLIPQLKRRGPFLLILNCGNYLMNQKIFRSQSAWITQEAILGFTQSQREKIFLERIIYHTKWEEWEYFDGDSWLMWTCWDKNWNLPLDYSLLWEKRDKEIKKNSGKREEGGEWEGAMEKWWVCVVEKKLKRDGGGGVFDWCVDERKWKREGNSWRRR